MTPSGWRPLVHKVKCPLDFPENFCICWEEGPRKGLPTSWGRSKLALNVEFDTVKTLPRNLQTFWFSLEILSWPLQSWIPSRALCVCFLSTKFCIINVLKRKLVWIACLHFYSASEIMSEISTQFGEIHTLTNSELNQMKQEETSTNNHKYKSCMTISNFPPGK